jgi:hypothetical protein
MTDNRLNTDDKNHELSKYRDLVLATIDYYLDYKLMWIKTDDFDSEEHYKDLKRQTEEHYQNGRLTRLKQCFRDLIEMQVETGDFKFDKYIRDKTKYDIDIFKSYFQRIDKVIAKEQITTDNQFYDTNIMVDKLCQTEPIVKERIALLKKLLADYEERKSRKKRKPTA